MNMRPNLVLKKMRRGETASCIKLNMADARTAKVQAPTTRACGVCAQPSWLRESA